MKMNKGFPQGKKKTNPTHFPYDLTIAMIIKNDFTILERCLESMKPLREALKCQLIITDTGSTDGARELAQAHADVLLDFEWCDDFAKARNTGVEKAQGRWFFYVDSDHEFDESYQALVDFILSPVGQNPATLFASITIRNYYGSTKNDSLNHKDTTNCILVNFSQGKLFFQSRIHESIPLPNVSAPHVPLLLHHWGYVDAKPEQKSKRNLAILLESLEEDPLDLKQQLQYVNDLKDTELCHKHLEKLNQILELPEAKVRESYPLMSFLCLIFQTNFYLMEQEYALCAETILQLRNRLKQTPSFLGTVLEVETDGLSYTLATTEKEPYDLQKEAFLQYQQSFYLLQETKIHTYSIYFNYNYTSALSFHKTELEFIEEAIALGNKEQALSLLSASTAYQAETNKRQYPHTKTFVTACLGVEAFSLIGENLEFLLKKDNAASYYLFQTTIEAYYEEHTEANLRPLFALLGKNPVDSYTALCYFRGQDYQWKDCPSPVISLLQKDQDYPHSPLFLDLFYGYVKYKEAPTDYLSGLNCELLPEMVQQLEKLHGDFFSLVLESIQSSTFTIQSLKEEQIWTHLGYAVLGLLGKSLAEDSTYQDHRHEILPCFKIVTKVMTHYIQTVYSPNILSPEGCLVLSQEEVFGFYSGLAMEQQEKDSLESIFKEMLSLCPPYECLVNFLRPHEQPQEESTSSPDTVEASPSVDPQVLALAREVKQKVLLLIQNGNLATAKQLLEKYRNIQPNDPELPDLLRRCGLD